MSKARGLADLGNAYSDGALSNRNLILNGAMTVSQRATSASPAPIGYMIDRFATYQNGPTVGDINIAQSSDAPAGFIKSALITVTTAGTPTGADYRIFQQAIEGNNFSVLSQGTAAAKAFTLSFWVKTSILGTFSGSMRDSTVSRSYVFEYTMNAINTWEYKTVTIAGSTGGTFNTNNAVGAYLSFSLGQGSVYSTATVGSWVTGNFHGSTTETDLVSTLGATFQITGVQLEVGDTATPFENRGFGQELALCQRYYHVAGSGVGGMTNSNAGYFSLNYLYPVEMRATPSCTILNTSFYLFFGSGQTSEGTFTVTTIRSLNVTKTAASRIQINSSTVSTNSSLSVFTGDFAMDAEL
jgi:hypothetical protein